MTQRTEIALKLMQQKCAKMNATELCRVSRPSGSKDRHSKVLTSKGPRDRRIRLSLETAVKFYEVQDRLGYDQPNKAIEWLIHKSQSAIDDLPQIPTTGFQISQFLYSNYLEHLSSFQSENGEAAEWNPFFANGNILSNSEKVNKGDLYSTGLSTETSAAQEFSPETTTREFSNKDTNKRSGSPIENSLWMEQQTLCSPCLSIRRKEEKLLSSRDRRAKARERARERTEATHSSKIGRKIYSHAGQLSVETERQNPTHRLCMQENMSSLKESVGENGNPLSTHPHAHAVSAKFSPAVEKLTHSQLLSRPQSSHRDFPEDSVNLGRSRSNLVFNGCLGEMEGSLQKSRQTNLQYCPPQHKGIRSIQSTETLNSTVFPISSLSSDSPFLNVVPSSQANLLTASSSCSPDCAYSQSLNFESSLQISISKLSSSSAAAECLNGSQFCYNQLRKVQELEAIQENPELQNACAEKLFSKTLSNISSLCSTLSSATRRSHTSCDSLMSSPSPVDANYYARELSFNNEDYSFENDMTNIPARIQGFEQFYDEIGDSYGVLQN